MLAINGMKEIGIGRNDDPGWMITVFMTANPYNTTLTSSHPPTLSLPSPQVSVLSNWEEQIRQHVLPNALSVHLYHSSNAARARGAKGECDKGMRRSHGV